MIIEHHNTWWLTPSSMNLFSVIAPQHPKNDTSTMMTPAAIATFATDI